MMVAEGEVVRLVATRSAQHGVHRIRRLTRYRSALDLRVKNWGGHQQRQLPDSPPGPQFHIALLIGRSRYAHFRLAPALLAIRFRAKRRPTGLNAPTRTHSGGIVVSHPPCHLHHLYNPLMAPASSPSPAGSRHAGGVYILSL